MACDTFSNIVQLARQIETSSSDAIGYGIGSKPMRNPAECGMKVDKVAVRDMNVTQVEGLVTWSVCSPSTPLSAWHSL